ncbi:MAG: hypothetical protein WCO56_08335 [Verrucomicrobiota bacterium]
MKYRCSNGHLFHSFEIPQKCPKHGCDSRSIRPDGTDPLRSPTPKPVAEGNAWTRMLAGALIILTLTGAGFGYLLKNQSRKNTQLERELKAAQQECLPLEIQLNARKGNPS